jgi:transcriptional regulator with XRE-family HTH domain
VIGLISLLDQMVNMKSYDIKTITGAQIRAGRALLRWSAEDLARAAMLGVATIRRAESVDGPVRLTVGNLAAIYRAFDAGGLEFISENGGGAGVRFKEPGSV